MKIDENTINHNALKQIESQLCDLFPEDATDEKKMAYNLGVVDGVTFLANALKKVLKE